MQEMRERILREAEFSPRIVAYCAWGAAIFCLATIVLIPLLPIVVPATVWYYRRYYRRLRVVLTSRDLKIHRGILVREEKSIPLEKITDLRLFQGPIMRHFEITGLAVETAGQTSGGALATVYGIVDTEGFRDQVLRQRDRIADADESPASDAQPRPAAGGHEQAMLETLTEIRDALQRIEGRLKE